MQVKDATILIVDDEVVLLEIFKDWFEGEGCRVLTAENGVQALDLLKTDTAHLVISDIRMPKMDGIQMAKKIKQTRKYFPKILFVSGFSDTDERDCCDLGIEMKLPKPIARGTLVSAVRVCLMDREERWRESPSVVAGKKIEGSFESLQGAREQGLIAFGHGGICVRYALPAHTGDAVGLNLEFSADQRAVAGQGIVRWADRQEQQIGIELSYIDKANLAWVVSLAEREGMFSFIPRSSYTGTPELSMSVD